MKYIWLGVMTSAVLMSGCTSMVYGNRTAPVVSLNNQRPLLNPPSANSSQAVALTPTRVPPRPVQRPVIQQPVQAVPVRPNVAQPIAPPAADEVQVIAQSPYEQSSVNQAASVASNNNDGWSVAPNSANAQAASPTVRDEPKPMRPDDSVYDAPKQNTNNTQQTVQEAQPVRPQDTNTENNAQQVASATPPQKAATPAPGETAVSALLKKASASLGKGDLDGAAAYLENAQRIEPQNAKILYDIANIRYHQGRYKDAENFAGKAVDKGGSNAMLKKSWALIANARKQLGDNQGAVAAAERAASY